MAKVDRVRARVFTGRFIVVAVVVLTISLVAAAQLAEPVKWGSPSGVWLIRYIRRPRRY